MPNNTPNINLDVRNFSSGDPGWHNVNASNGQPYSYCYTGGDDTDRHPDAPHPDRRR